jgi:hypothetical protein
MSDWDRCLPPADRAEEPDPGSGREAFRRLIEKPKARQESEPASVFTEAARQRAAKDRAAGSPEERIDAILRGGRQPGEDA